MVHDLSEINNSLWKKQDKALISFLVWCVTCVVPKISCPFLITTTEVGPEAQLLQ